MNLRERLASSKHAAKPVDLTDEADWEHSEALTRVIPQAAELEPPPVRARPRPFEPAPVVAKPALPKPPPPKPAPPKPAPPKPIVAPPPPPKAPSSLVRRASYLLAVLVMGMLGFNSYSRLLGNAKAGSARARVTASSAAAPEVAKKPKARPLLEVRAVEAPTVKEAAAAFARGDYREALAQYRALAQRQPAQAAYKSLIHILERRLAPKTPQ